MEQQMAIVHEGVLQLGKNPSSSSSKDWKAYLCVLKHNPEKRMSVLDLYKDLKKRWQKQERKASIELWPNFHISLAHSCSYQFPFKLTSGDKRDYFLSAGTFDSMNKWFNMLQMQSYLVPPTSRGQYYEFEVIAINSPSTSMIGAVGSCILAFTLQNEVVCALLPNRQKVGVWPYTSLRTYWGGKEKFGFKAGRRSPRGEGEFVFATHQGEEIFRILERVIKNMSQVTETRPLAFLPSDSSSPKSGLFPVDPTQSETLPPDPTQSETPVPSSESEDDEQESTSNTYTHLPPTGGGGGGTAPPPGWPTGGDPHMPLALGIENGTVVSETSPAYSLSSGSQRVAPVNYELHDPTKDPPKYPSHYSSPKNPRSREDLMESPQGPSLPEDKPTHSSPLRPLTREDSFKQSSPLPPFPKDKPSPVPSLQSNLPRPLSMDGSIRSALPPPPLDKPPAIPSLQSTSPRPLSREISAAKPLVQSPPLPKDKPPLNRSSIPPSSPPPLLPRTSAKSFPLTSAQAPLSPTSKHTPKGEDDDDTYAHTNHNLPLQFTRTSSLKIIEGSEIYHGLVRSDATSTSQAATRKKRSDSQVESESEAQVYDIAFPPSLQRSKILIPIQEGDYGSMGNVEEQQKQLMEVKKMLPSRGLSFGAQLRGRTDSADSRGRSASGASITKQGSEDGMTNNPLYGSREDAMLSNLVITGNNGPQEEEVICKHTTVQGCLSASTENLVDNPVYGDHRIPLTSPPPAATGTGEWTFVERTSVAAPPPQGGPKPLREFEDSLEINPTYSRHDLVTGLNLTELNDSFELNGGIKMAAPHGENFADCGDSETGMHRESNPQIGSATQKDKDGEEPMKKDDQVSKSIRNKDTDALKDDGKESYNDETKSLNRSSQSESRKPPNTSTDNESHGDKGDENSANGGQEEDKTVVLRGADGYSKVDKSKKTSNVKTKEQEEEAEKDGDSPPPPVPPRKYSNDTINS